MKDYYQILGIGRDASQQEIKKTFRRLASCYHPDHNPRSQRQAEEKFKEINEAYQVLGDEYKGQQYDYMVALAQGSQEFVRKNNFGVPYSQVLDEETLRQLLQLLTSCGVSFGYGPGYIRGCRLGYGRRCQRWGEP
jgi:DnaJ-class molecular chaperone